MLPSRRAAISIHIEVAMTSCSLHNPTPLTNIRQLTISLLSAHPFRVETHSSTSYLNPATAKLYLSRYIMRASPMPLYRHTSTLATKATLTHSSYSMAPPEADQSRTGQSDTSSLTTTSSTSSTAQLLKAKFLSKIKPSPSSKEETLSPGEKQAARKAARTNPEALAAYAALR